MTTLTIDNRDWQGIDVDNAISIFEYGILYRDTGDSIEFILEVPTRRGTKYGTIEIDKNRSFDRIDKSGIESFMGLKGEKHGFEGLSLVWKVKAICDYHGSNQIIERPRFNDVALETERGTITAEDFA